MEELENALDLTFRHEGDRIVRDKTFHKEFRSCKTALPVEQVRRANGAMLEGRKAGDPFSHSKARVVDRRGLKAVLRCILECLRIGIKEQDISRIDMKLGDNKVEKFLERYPQVKAGGNDHIDGMERGQALQPGLGLPFRLLASGNIFDHRNEVLRLTGRLAYQGDRQVDP